MDDSQEGRARELVEELERVGGRCGLLAVQGSVVMRCPGAPYTDSPLMSFDETDLQNAIALDLLEKRKVKERTEGKLEWEWYMSTASLMRIFVTDSPDGMWQYPVEGQVISQFEDGSHYCLTKQAINFRHGDKLRSCTHDDETLARYKLLLKRSKGQ
jgi:hypothetical protein